MLEVFLFLRSIKEKPKHEYDRMNEKFKLSLFSLYFDEIINGILTDCLPVQRNIYKEKIYNSLGQYTALASTDYDMGEIDGEGKDSQMNVVLHEIPRTLITFLTSSMDAFVTAVFVNRFSASSSMLPSLVIVP